MDYNKIYNSLIQKAKIRGWTKKTSPVYCESHHILPKSMGGSNKKENKVVLTAREHLVSHKLLYLIHRNPQMTFALWNMLHDKRGNIRNFLCGQYNSKSYEKLRVEMSARLKQIHNNREPFFHTEETKKKLSIAHLGKVLSEETKAKMSVSRKGNTCQSKGLYITPLGISRSLRELARLNGCSTTTVQERCKRSRCTITSNKFPDYRGKTWRELGWFYLEDLTFYPEDLENFFEKRVTSYSHNPLIGEIDYSKYKAAMADRVIKYS